MIAKHSRFVQEYLIDFNGAQAAIRAGYSPKTAKEQASRLLTNANVKAEIERLQAKTTEKLEVTKEDLIRDLLHIKDTCLEDPRGIHNSIKAIEVITKMLGLNEPTKTDITTNGQPIQPEIKINIIQPKQDGNKQ